MGSLFPRIVREHCHPNIPTAACHWRREKEMLGSLRFDRIAMGWVLFGDPAYRRTMRDGRKLKKFQIVKRNGGYDTTGDLYILEICPGCGCELPDSDGDNDE